MTFLLDTSVVVAILTREASSYRVAQWLRDNSEARLPIDMRSDETFSTIAVAAWAEAELSSALAMKRRLGRLSASDWAAAVRLFDDMIPWPWIVIDVERDHFEDAARLCDDYELGLRAPDALHLAVAARAGRTLVTLDRKLLNAAVRLGYRAITP